MWPTGVGVNPMQCFGTQFIRLVKLEHTNMKYISNAQDKKEKINAGSYGIKIQVLDTILSTLGHHCIKLNFYPWKTINLCQHHNMGSISYLLTHWRRMPTVDLHT